MEQKGLKLYIRVQNGQLAEVISSSSDRTMLISLYIRKAPEV